MCVKERERERETQMENGLEWLSVFESPHAENTKVGIQSFEKLMLRLSSRHGLTLCVSLPSSPLHFLGSGALCPPRVAKDSHCHSPHKSEDVKEREEKTATERERVRGMRENMAYRRAAVLADMFVYIQ